ncbi:MAG: ADP-ribosylglycohydrolase family protein [Erysipelotrichaceae bacterium]|nr:ADP-ribosylglycohydrolase family protein [Erysipelotrichaceae bacterium]
MYGAIIGDIAGSRFEFYNRKSKDFTLFDKNCEFTDDSVMTIAVAKALVESKKNKYEDLEEQLIFWMHEIGKRYPGCGYGGKFYYWIMNDETKPYHSFGNGSGMRTSMCAEIAESLGEALDLAKRCAAVTHNHEEGIKGAKAITAAAYLAKSGSDKKEIGDYIQKHFYDIDFTLDEIRKNYHFDVTCQGSVPQAIESFLESESYEDCIRNAISIGGDSDTIAAMAGAIAENYYGLPEGFKEKADAYLDDYLKGIIRSIEEEQLSF